MDVEWATGRLRAFMALADAYAPAALFERSTERHEYRALLRAWPTVQKILVRCELTPTFTAGSMAWDAMARGLCEQAVGYLEDLDEAETRLGDGSPTVDLAGLHPWVWGAAQSFWSPGGYRVAVQQAATALTGHTQQKVARYDVADDALMAEVFGKGPATADRPRLRLPGDEEDATRQSRQRGARALAEGCFWGLRNPAAHTVAEWSEQAAVEALCAFSLLARLIDECDVAVA